MVERLSPKDRESKEKNVGRELQDSGWPSEGGRSGACLRTVSSKMS